MSPSVPTAPLAPEPLSEPARKDKEEAAMPLESVSRVPKPGSETLAVATSTDALRKPQDISREAHVSASPQPAAVTDVSMDADDVPVSLTAKVELVEARLPSPSPLQIVVDYSPQLPTRRPDPPADPPPSVTSQVTQNNTEPRRVEARSPVPSLSQHNLARTVSHEDGEIFSPPPLKPLPLAPRAHSPPTQPRSFHAHSGSTSPVRPPPPPPPRRLLQPASHRPQLPNGGLNSRPLPSGPRALRGLSGNGGHYFTPFSGGGGAPRAPSADRDRDHRMDWDRDNRRGSSWSRGRGGGGWGR